MREKELKERQEYEMRLKEEQERFTELLGRKIQLEQNEQMAQRENRELREKEQMRIKEEEEENTLENQIKSKQALKKAQFY